MKPEELFGTKEKSPPETPSKETSAVYAENKHALDDAKTALELRKIRIEEKKLELEEARLSQGNTAADPYKLLMEMKDMMHQQLLNMQQKNFDIQIQLARTELASDDDTMRWIEFLEPYLPQLIGAFSGKKTNEVASGQTYVHDEKGNLIPNPKIYNKDGSLVNGTSSTKQGVSSDVTHNPSVSPASNSYDMDLKNYQEAIKRGEISLEQAWKDFGDMKENLPLHLSYLKNMTFEQFKANYDKIRGEK